MDAYMTPDVADWAKKAKVTHKILLKAAQEVTKGLVDANHRFGLYKKRVATNTGQGKRDDTTQGTKAGCQKEGRSQKGDATLCGFDNEGESFFAQNYWN